MDENIAQEEFNVEDFLDTTCDSWMEADQDIFNDFSSNQFDLSFIFQKENYDFNNKKM